MFLNQLNHCKQNLKILIFGIFDEILEIFGIFRGPKIENLDFLETYVAAHIPAFKVMRPQGTYLAWVDCRSLGLDGDSLNSLIMDKAKVYLDRGDVFGIEGEGFMRFNVACSRALLEEALERIAREVTLLDK